MATPGEKTVLVAEDDRGLNDLLVDLFSLTGYRVIRTFDGAEAYRLIGDERPDVVILDLMLPGMTGQDMLRRVKSEPTISETPFVVVTGFADRLGEEERELASAVLIKPFEVDHLLAEVERLAWPVA